MSTQSISKPYGSVPKKMVVKKKASVQRAGEYCNLLVATSFMQSFHFSP